MIIKLYSRKSLKLIHSRLFSVLVLPRMNGKGLFQLGEGGSVDEKNFQKKKK